MQKSDDSAMQKSLSATSPAETAPKKLHALPRSGCREPLQTKEVWRCFLRTMLRCPFHFCFRIVDDSFCFFLLVFFRHWRENGLAVGCYICIGDRFSENWPQGSGRRTGEVQSHTKHFRNLREIHLQQPKTLGVCAVYRGWTTTQFNMGISSSDTKKFLYEPISIMNFHHRILLPLLTLRPSQIIQQLRDWMIVFWTRCSQGEMEKYWLRIEWETQRRSGLEFRIRPTESFG